MIRQVMSRVLIGGAGITGAATAAALRQHLPDDVTITFWDKSRGSGGRMSTSRKPGDDTCTVDLGAQYFTLFPQYREERQGLFQDLEKAGVFQEFQGVIEGDNSVNCKQYIAPAGSGSLVKHFLAESRAETQYSHHITSVNYSPGAGEKVKVSTQTDTSEDFDVVILTLPVPQILQLTGTIQQTIARQAAVKSSLESVSYSSRFCLGLFYPPDTEFPYTWDAKYFKDGPCIRFVAIDNRKRGVHDVAPSVLVHTSVPFSIEHLEIDKEEMRPVILQHLRDILPDLPEPELVKSHKWRYSQVFKPYPGAPGCVVIEQNPLIVLTGDAFAEKGNFCGCMNSVDATVDVVKHYINNS